MWKTSSLASEKGRVESATLACAGQDTVVPPTKGATGTGKSSQRWQRCKAGCCYGMGEFADSTNEAQIGRSSISVVESEGLM